MSNPLGTAKQFVYAQQDILGGSQRTNDLVVVNDADYRDSGICVGPGGPYNNMRLAYSVSDGSGSITTDKLNVNVEQLYFNNLPNAQNINKSCNYLVADNSGNVKEGYPMFKGDITSEVNTIKSDIILIKQSLGLPVVQPTTIDTILSYVAIVLCIIFLIILIILLFRIHKLNKKLTAAEERIEEMMGTRITPPKPTPTELPQQFPPNPYYPYYFQQQQPFQQSQASAFQAQQQLFQQAPVSLPPAPVSLPSAPVTLPPAPVTLPPAPVTLPPAPVSLPSAPVSLPSAPVSLPQVTNDNKIQALAQIQQSLSRESK